MFDPKLELMEIDTPALPPHYFHTHGFTKAEAASLRSGSVTTTTH